MESKQTNFKMYKIGRRWAFACAVLLTLGSSAVVARADDAAPAPATGTSTSEQTATGDELTSQTQVLPAGSQAKSSTQGTQAQTESAQGSGDNVKTPTTTPAPTSDQNNGSGTTEQPNTQPASGEAQLTTDSAAKADTPANDKTTPQPAATTNESTDAGAASQKVAPESLSLDSANTAVTATANDAVKDGGYVEDDYPDLHNLLGISSQFHIFAREADLGTHTNGNVAVGNLIGNVNFGTNIIEELLDKDISYIQNVTNIASSSFVSAGDTRINKVIFGENVEIDVSNPNRPKVNGIDIDHLLAEEVYQDKNGNVYIDFDKEFAKLEQLSASLSEQKPVASYTASDFPDMNNRVIDVTDMQPDENGRIVINLSADVLAGNTPLTIKGLSSDKDGNTIIINVDTEGTTDYDVNSAIKIIYDDGSERNSHETEYFGDNHLLWNFYDSTAADKLVTGNVDFNAVFQGSVLAPAAEVTANHNLDGNIIADKVNVKGETHRWDLQDNVDNEKDPETPEPDEEDLDKPVAPIIDVELPAVETPGKPGIDVELPSIDEEEDDEDSVEEPNVGEPDVDETSEEELEADFEETLDEPASEQIEDDQTLLAEIDRAIEKAQAEGNTALVKQLEALKARVEAALKVAEGQSLPQTGEQSQSVASLLGLVLAGNLAIFGLGSRRRKHQN